MKCTPLGSSEPHEVGSVGVKLHAWPSSGAKSSDAEFMQ
mgnify:CR=1 FL=1